ncbi:MAG TPA: MFS transporter [Thermoanaerobaculia bacterium]|jgi:MFS family permease
MKKFYVIWAGQIVSMLGSGLSGFGLGVWIYMKTGSATQFAMTALFMMLPNLVVGPLGGLLADRFDRRKLLAISDCGQAAGTLVMAALLFTGNLEVWHIYVATVSGAIFNCFRWPAFNAMLPSIAPKQHLMRINGLVSAGEAATMIASPLLAGLLVATIGLAGVLLIDVITFIVGMALLFTIRIPKVERAVAAATQEIGSRTRNYWRIAVSDTREGWVFLRDRGALVGLLGFFAFTNLCLGMIEMVFTPLVLSVASVRTLGATSSIAAVGMLLGSIAISMWGGPRRRVLLILGFGALQGIIAIVVGWQTSIATLMFGAFAYVFLFPIIGACCQTLWQTKVPNELQGRVGAVRMMVFNVVRPMSFFLAGALSDHVFGPRVLVMVMGGITVLGTLAAFASSRIRNLELALPDITTDDAIPAAQAA